MSDLLPSHVTFRCVTLLIGAVAMGGCSREATPRAAVRPRIVATTPTHNAERVAVDFVNAVRRDDFANHVPDFPVDAELSPQDRIVAFRMLERFIKSQEWSLWFTSVEIINGEEDSVDCYFRGTRDDMLVLLLGYHYDAEEWRIGAYEIPDRTFARPAGESYGEYIARSISGAKRGARPFSDGIHGDGRYFIDYRSDR